MSKKRNRGVILSATKICDLMGKNNLKNNDSLSQFIADFEGVDTLPSDLVKKAMAELPLDWSSVARITRAFGTEAALILKSSDEKARATLNDDPERVLNHEQINKPESYVTHGNNSPVIKEVTIGGDFIFNGSDKSK